jgi:hypothetical protein
VFVAAAGVCGVLILLWFFPKAQVGAIPFEKPDAKLAAEGEVRKTLAQMIAGIAFLATFYVS